MSEQEIRDAHFDAGWACALFWAHKILSEKNDETSIRCILDKFKEMSGKPMRGPAQQSA
jgi:hypothetical protein